MFDGLKLGRGEAELDNSSVTKAVRTVEYSPEFQARAVNDLALLPADSAIVEMLSEYVSYGSRRGHAGGNDQPRCSIRGVSGGTRHVGCLRRQIVVVLSGPQAFSMIVDDPCLELRGDAVPVPINRTGQLVLRHFPTTFAFAERTRNGLDVALIRASREARPAARSPPSRAPALGHVAKRRQPPAFGRDARQIVEAMRTGLIAGIKEVATAFVSAAGGSAEARRAVGALREALSRDGYRIVDTRDQSAVALEISWGGDERRTMSVGSSTVQTATVSLSLVGGWTYRDEPFLRSTVQGEGRSFSPSDVVEKGIEAAVDKLVEAMNSAIAG